MKHARTTRVILLTMCLLAIVVMPLLAAGCNNSNQLDAGATKIKQQTSGASVAIMDANGNQSAAFHGLAPTHLKQDDSGNWYTAQGPVTVFSFPTQAGTAYVISPKDTVFMGVEYTPMPADGQPMFKADSISSIISVPLEQHKEALISALATLEGMTKIEAEATVAKWVEAGNMLRTVADVLMQIIAVAF